MQKHQKSPQNPRVRFWQSQVFRVFLGSSIAFLLAFIVSAWGSWLAIDALSRIIYDTRVDKGLQDYLVIIKKHHQSEQELLRLKLESYITAKKLEVEALQKEELLKALDNLSAKGLALLSDPYDVLPYDEKNSDDLDLPPPPIGWLDRDHFKVGKWVIKWSHTLSYDAYRVAEDSKNFYSTLKATVNDVVKPQILRYASISYIGVVLLVLIFSLILTRKFKTQIDRLIEGFSFWADKEPKFRFGLDDWYGELGLIAAKFNDIAEEVEFNRKKAAYLEKVAGWQTMAKKLAHEIKNPLTPIKMMVSQLGRSYQGEDPKFRALLGEAKHVIDEEINHLTRLVDSFTMFAKLPDARLQVVALAPIINDILSLEAHAFSFVTMKADISQWAQQQFVEADSGLIKQLLKNLIKNAAEALKGTEKPEIVVDLQPHTDQHGRQLLKLSVIDNGPGIPLELRDKIFDPYVSTKHSGKDSGMGLGLAICHKIALDHGSQLSFESRVGRTEFFMFFKIKEK